MERAMGMNLTLRFYQCQVSVAPSHNIHISVTSSFLNMATANSIGVYRIIDNMIIIVIHQKKQTDLMLEKWNQKSSDKFFEHR